LANSKTEEKKDMARKEDTLDNWITSKVAATILTARSGHVVTIDYVRRLGNTGKIETRPIDARTKLYSRKDIEAYTVKARGDGSVRRAARAPREKKEEVESAA
jgi:hypothetical protein